MIYFKKTSFFYVIEALHLTFVVNGFGNSIYVNPKGHIIDAEQSL